MENTQNAIVVAAFYLFVILPDYREMRAGLLEVCTQHGIKGTILLAEEGINGTIAGARTGIDSVFASVKQDPRFDKLTHKESYLNSLPFQRMKVKLKREIVTLGIPQVDPQRQVGSYVDPKEWNRLIADPTVLVLDTRNQYEVEVGTFHGAVNPETASFRQFPDYVRQNLDPQKHTKIAMFCTGGIRCEKASSFLLSQGFPEVYHLQGGILKYLETMPPEESQWEGECFVFDERVTVDQSLSPGTRARCRGCGYPIPADEEQAHTPCPQCGAAN